MEKLTLEQALDNIQDSARNMQRSLETTNSRLERRCYEESESIRALVEALKEADGWSGVREVLRPYFRGDETWPGLPEYDEIFRAANREAFAQRMQISKSVNEARGAAREDGMAHQLRAVARSL